MKKTIIIAAVLLFIILGKVFNTSRVSEYKMEVLRNSECQHHLRKIYLSIQNYVHEFGDFPDRLDSLTRQSPDIAQFFSCPVSNKNGIGYEYVYSGNFPAGDDAVPLLCDKKGNHKGYINVQMSDSGIMTIPENELAQSVAEYNRQARINRRPFQEIPKINENKTVGRIGKENAENQK